jgi:rhodanese-related sulfurtransferase
LAARTGAPIYLHESAGAQFLHQQLREGDILSLGAVRVHILHTPGHTPESVTLLIRDQERGEEPALALTGDTLFVGDIGRPDLVGADAARDLAGAMHDSLARKLLPLPDGLLVYPAHGAGSLCGRNMGSMRLSTIGYERHNNPALAPRGREEFVLYATTDLPEQPANHTRIKALNRQGPRVLGTITPRCLSADAVAASLHRGAGLLDLRSHAEYVARHIPGAVHLPANDELSNRVGMLLPADTSLILQLDDPSDYARVAYMLARVGFDDVTGYFENLEEWQAQGHPVTSGDVREISPQELESRIANDSRLVVLDVREPWEYKRGHVPSAVLIPLGQLQARYSELDPALPVAVICETGSRSQTGAALLAQKGFKQVFNVREGTAGWKKRGYPVAI